MNKKQQSKQQITIPGFVWAIAVIIVLCIVFIFVVQAPFSKKIDKYNADHESAQSKIAMFEDYLARAEEVEAKIEQMKEQYNEESKKLFVNATQTPADIRTMVNQLNIKPNSVSVSEGSVDGQGRSSSTGDPLYVTRVAINFVGSEADLLSTLDYFELESDGSYYVENLNVTEVESTTGGKNVSVVSSDKQYNISLSLSLYYFPPKIDEVSTTPVVSGSAALVSVASGSSSTSSAASKS